MTAITNAQHRRSILFLRQNLTKLLASVSDLPPADACAAAKSVAEKFFLKVDMPCHYCSSATYAQHWWVKVGHKYALSVQLNDGTVKNYKVRNQSWRRVKKKFQAYLSADVRTVLLNFEYHPEGELVLLQFSLQTSPCKHVHIGKGELT